MSRLASTFEQAGVWDAFSEREARRVEATLGYVPEVETVLDVGCGDGRFLHSLAGRAKTACGVDLSFEAVRRVTTARVQGSAVALPFRAGAFDLVTATEILEHLPGPALEDALGEMVRVSRRFVLVSVPFRENLREELCRCAGCGEVFHRYGHLHSFERGRLEAPSPALRLERMGTMVPIRKSRPLALLYWLQHRFGARYQWDANVRCPTCGGEAARPAGNLLGRLAQKVIWRVDRSLPRVEDGWLVALYRKAA
jgi:SAM-dependent methyltransferase